MQGKGWPPFPCNPILREEEEMEWGGWVLSRGARGATPGNRRVPRWGKERSRGRRVRRGEERTGAGMTRLTGGADTGQKPGATNG